MSAEVRIRRFDLRIRRRGPAWLMRSDHRGLAERVRTMVLAELEPLLASLLASPSMAPATRVGPLDIRLRIAESALRDSTAVASGLRMQAAAALRTALTRASSLVAPESLAASAWPAPPQPTFHEPATLAATPIPAGILSVLARWQSEGVLTNRLARWDANMLARCRDAVLAALAQLPPPPGGYDGDPSAAAIAAGQTPAGWPPTPFPSRPEDPDTALGGPAAELLALVALAVRYGRWQPPPAALRPFQRLRAPAHVVIPPAATPISVPQLHPTPPATRDATSTRAEISAALAVQKPVTAQPLQPPQIMPDRADLATALPFLLLGPLHCMGWLEAVDLALALGNPAHAPALGFALALKVLPPPARGWRREPALLQAAALAAGLAEPPPGAALAAAERALAPLMAASDAVLADALLRGHTPGAPVGLVVARDGLLALFEPEGLFPIALADDWATLASAAPADAPVLVGPGVSSAVLHAIAETHCFAAPGAPIRGETWRTLIGPGGWRGISNSGAPLGHATASWAEQAAQAVAVADSFGPERPLAPNLPAGTLDRSLGLAASVGLGSIAWALAAHDPEPWTQPDPLLAFDRFTSLSARLRVSLQEIEILLPLGPRSRDLRAAGLLNDVDSIPWLAPRRLRFVVG